MRVIYAYEAPRDETLEREIASDLSARFGPASQTDAVESASGIISVTLDLDVADHPAAEGAAERIRVRGRVIDAAAESLGEGA